MSPPYHLRPNKAVDRHIFIEALSRLMNHSKKKSFHYIGMGGDYMKDFAAIYKKFPNFRFTSVESLERVHKRQMLHAPCKQVECICGDIGDYISNSMPEDQPVIAWLDFTGLNENDIRIAQSFVQQAAVGSLLRVTFRAQVAERTGKGANSQWDRFSRDLGAFAPERPAELAGDWVLPLSIQAYKQGLEGIVSTYDDVKFHLLQITTYRDTAKMVSVLGVIGSNDNYAMCYDSLVGWEFFSRSWDVVHVLQTPELSIRERLLLSRHLPQPNGTGKHLRRVLGYDLADSEEQTIMILDQYRKFHLVYPMFGEVDF